MLPVLISARQNAQRKNTVSLFIDGKFFADFSNLEQAKKVFVDKDARAQQQGQALSYATIKDKNSGQKLWGVRGG